MYYQLISIQNLAFILILYLLSTRCDTATLTEPYTIIATHESTYHLRAEYCLFTVFDDESRLVVNMSTRCFCYKSYCNVPGPTFIVQAGSKINIILSNNMVGARHNMSLMNNYKDLDVTNLHTHGLHVDPAVDDMFIYIDPIHPDSLKKDKHQKKPRINAHKYEYEIISQHQSGTHWYHAHWHGCVALALSGGQFGALIIENEKNDKQIPNLFEMSSNILMLQSLWILNATQCDCDNLAPENNYVMNGFFMVYTHCSLYCQQPKYQRDLSGIKYDMTSHPKYQSRRIYFVNGQYMPSIDDIKVNEWRRLRFINADISQYFQLDFTRNDHNELTCNNTCHIRIMAMDGTYLKDIDRNLCNYPYYGHIMIPPGGRADIAIQCNTTQIINVKSSEKNLYDYMANYTRALDGVILFKLEIIADIQPSFPLLQSFMKTKIDSYPKSAPDSPYYLQSLIDGESDQTVNYPVYTQCDCTLYNRSLFTMEMDMNQHMNMPGMKMKADEVKILPFCSNYKDDNDASKIDECNNCGFYFLGMPWTNINFRRFSMNEPLLYVLPDSVYEFKTSAKGVM